MAKIYKLYVDNCCLNRPFDDQTQDRIRLEAESIVIMFKYVSKGIIKLVGSDVLIFEIEKTPDMIRKSQLKSLTRYISKTIHINDEIYKRGMEIEAIGFPGIDALHIASAESEKIDAFLTTDDKILKLYKKHKNVIAIEIRNPLEWLQEFIVK